MINRLQIKFFMAQKKQDIVFSPNVNVIIGENYAGKSTILRAIKYVAKNKPTGDSVINWDADKTAVRITVGKNKITRIRSKSINLYKLNKKEYKAFGNDVPEDIQKVLGLSDINFQGQHDAPFWFCETAGEVSRQLNMIVNLDVIDNTLKHIDSGIREVNTTIKVIQLRLKTGKEKQEELAYIKEMNEDLLVIESLREQKTQKAVERSVLADLLKSGRLYASQRETGLNQVLCGQIGLDKSLKRQEITERVESLLKLIKSAKVLQKAVKNRPPSFEPISLLRKRKIKNLAKIAELESFMERIEEREDELCLLQKQLKVNEKKLKVLAKGKCPLCGKKMK